eukprot:4220-Heterococcus_DN1.PRE.4
MHRAEEYLDVVPSDVAAGIVLLRATQHEAQQSQESYRQRRHPSIILQQQQLQEQLQLGSVSHVQFIRGTQYDCAAVHCARERCRPISSTNSTVLTCDAVHLKDGRQQQQLRAAIAQWQHLY